MDTPNSPYEDMKNVLPEWHEPFPEPHTIPSGWDLSEVLAAPTLATIDATDATAKG